MPSNGGVTLKYATSSSEATDASSKHEKADIGHGKVTNFNDLCSTSYAADSTDRAQ